MSDPTPTTLKLGRNVRTFDPRVPHMSAFLAAQPLPAIPDSHDWAANLPVDIGMMLNNMYGDCVEACAYHSLQVWTETARHVEITEADSFVERAYSEVAGFDPNNPVATDNGTVMQDFMKYAVNMGLPIPVIPGSSRSRHKYMAFIEVDPRNFDDLCLAIYEFGVVAIGFNVPRFIVYPATPQVWDLNSQADNTIVGGHCVGLTGFNKTLGTFNVMSWGLHNYQVTDQFLVRFCDEAYAVADPSWLTTQGKSPLGMSITQLEGLMSALKSGG
jgi:hypothetical protein